MRPTRLWLPVLAAVLAGCASTPPPAPPVNASAARAMIDRALPRAVNDRSGWLNDIYAAFTVLSIQPSHENACAVVSVIQQESGFQIDPIVPGLGTIASKEIDSRAVRAHVPLVVVHGVLGLKSPDGRTYAQRIDSARTEKDLSDLYEDLIDEVPLGRTLFDDKNPIRTRGPMQVNVAFARQYASAAPYPYPVTRSVDDELFTRRGSVYFGVAHLLGYDPPYGDYLFRFADYNAGQYASRNAAFQRALTLASGIELVDDGALLPPAERGDTPGATELALRTLARRLRSNDAAIHKALERGKRADFEQTAVYVRVFELAGQKADRPLPRALLPVIDLQGPKIHRRLTTAWYAERVQRRYERCLRSS